MMNTESYTILHKWLCKIIAIQHNDLTESYTKKRDPFPQPEPGIFPSICRILLAGSKCKERKKL